MSYQAVESVMKYSRTKAEARLVLMVIATHASADTFTASAGYELISSEANLSERTLIRYIKELEKTGELLIVRGNGKGNFTRYTIALPQVAKGDNSLHPLDAERVTAKGDKIAPIEPQRVTNEPSKGDKIEPKGDKTSGAYIDIEPLTILTVAAEQKHYQRVAAAATAMVRDGSANVGKYDFQTYESFHREMGKCVTDAEAINRARWALKNGKDDQAVAAWQARKSARATPAKRACACDGSGFIFKRNGVALNPPEECTCQQKAK
jgi:predicted transcriptional regulator